MSVRCPNCDKKFTPKKSPQPGRYRLTCPQCEEPFQLTIPTDPSQPWQAKSLVGRTQIVPASSLHQPVATRTVVVEVGAFPSPSQYPNLGQDTGCHLIETPSPELTSRSPVRSAAATEPALTLIPRSGLPSEKSLPRVSAKLPGYRVERAIGTGGMGSVYLGRQLSLDRPVAIKVMSNRWANDPIFVARFTREAFAAALLNHPNVVQIYDIGDSDGVKFFSMEYVAGRTLSDLVKREGKLDPETAVGYVLQAARGLKHAHDRGMIHRDVKPDNLLLDEQGIVKVADLGLVKTPEMQRAADRLDTSLEGPRSGLHSIPAQMTGARVALGTPAYMAPEQCRDAASVDHRADIYSLGCTLYVLVTGRAPFEGSSAIELMTKHAYEPVVPPETIVSRLPKELSVVIQKMMAKDPADRYQTMGEVIRILEQWLGIHHAGTFCPRDEQIDQLEQYNQAFNQVTSGQLRSHVITGFIGVCLLAAVLLSFIGQLTWAVGVSSMILQTAAAYFFLHGVSQKTYLFRRVRQFLIGLSIWDWLLMVAGGALGVLLLWMLGLFWVTAGFGLIGIGLAFGLRFALDKKVEEERQESLKRTDRLLRRMRLVGVDEEDIRAFVAKYAGKDWEEFFEALFGYEAKIQARQLLQRGGIGGNREKYAAWREPIIALIDHIEKSRQESRDQALLQKVEQARLLASGESLRDAKEQAARSAAALAQQAKAIRSARQHQGRVVQNTQINLQQIAKSTSTTPFELPVDEPPSSLIRTMAGLMFGPIVRAMLAALLLAACVLWMVQNQLGFGIDWKAQAQQTIQAVESQDLESLQNRASHWEMTNTRTLEIEGLPRAFTAWIDSASVGWAGLFLLGSFFYRGNRMGFLTILGAAIVVFGHRIGIRSVEPLQDYHVSWLLGTVIALVGFRMGYR